MSVSFAVYNVVSVLTLTIAFTAFTDLVLALYPVSIVYNLQMTRRLKFGLGILMGVGMFTCVCSIMKTYCYKWLLDVPDPMCESIFLLGF